MVKIYFKIQLKFDTFVGIFRSLGHISKIHVLSQMSI